MPVIPVVAPTILRMTMHTNLGNGRIANNVLDVSVDIASGATRDATILTLVPQIRDLWQDHLVGGMGNSYSFTGGTYTDLDSMASISGSFGVNGSKPVNSGSASAMTPPNACFLVTKNCAHTRTQRAGRWYFPAVIENTVDDHGDIDGTHTSGLAAGLETMRIALSTGLGGGASTAWRVVHVTGHDGTPVPGHPHGRPNAWNSTDVTGFTVATRVGTQRRRVRG